MPTPKIVTIFAPPTFFRANSPTPEQIEEVANSARSVSGRLAQESRLEDAEAVRRAVVFLQSYRGILEAQK